ncbi:hypothetical protein ACIRRA_26985 [Nocardia sp. NPDC101769]|uniref:hypothetical protein n=1 Tax=Nocardia sp. NPDC101769 TaxID=3364333 RepID=UPI003803EA6C
MTVQLAAVQHNQKRSVVVGVLTPDKDRSMTVYTYDPQSQAVSAAETVVALTPEQGTQRVFKRDSVSPQVLMKVQSTALNDAGTPGGTLMSVTALENLKDPEPLIEASVMVDQAHIKTVRYDLTGKLIA